MTDFQPNRQMRAQEDKRLTGNIPYIARTWEWDTESKSQPGLTCTQGDSLGHDFREAWLLGAVLEYAHFNNNHSWQTHSIQEATITWACCSRPELCVLHSCPPPSLKVRLLQALPALGTSFLTHWVASHIRSPLLSPLIQQCTDFPYEVESELSLDPSFAAIVSPHFYSALLQVPLRRVCTFTTRLPVWVWICSPTSFYCPSSSSATTILIRARGCVSESWNTCRTPLVWRALSSHKKSVFLLTTNYSLRQTLTRYFKAIYQRQK